MRFPSASHLLDHAQTEGDKVGQLRELSLQGRAGAGVRG